MDNFTCDVCGSPAAVHETEIRDGEEVERHLCAEHADLSDIPPGLAPGQMIVSGVVCSTVEEAAMQRAVDNLRGSANFARRHGRMPASVEELREGMALQDDVAGVEIRDPAVRAQLKWIDALIEFCKTHGRMPRTPDETGRCSCVVRHCPRLDLPIASFDMQLAPPGIEPV
jgi:hypothetical protein